MGFIIGLLTLFLVLDCIVLVFLVLIPLPKKEAGAGLAFGGAASDALFGAGSGNVLTKITKYAATIFFVMAVFLSIVQSRHYSRSSIFQQKLTQPANSSMALPAAPTRSTPPTTTPLTSTAAPASTNGLTILPQEAATPSSTATNVAAPK
jgi:preprotein translocase subunit SecG